MTYPLLILADRVRSIMALVVPVTDELGEISAEVERCEAAPDVLWVPERTFIGKVCKAKKNVEDIGNWTLFSKTQAVITIFPVVTYTYTRSIIAWAVGAAELDYCLLNALSKSIKANLSLDVLCTLLFPFSGKEKFQSILWTLQYDFCLSRLI